MSYKKNNQYGGSKCPTNTFTCLGVKYFDRFFQLVSSSFSINCGQEFIQWLNIREAEDFEICGK